MDDTDLIDLIVNNGSPSDIHAKIKELISQKATQNIDDVTPYVAASMFGAEIPSESEEDTEGESEGESEEQSDDSDDETDGDVEDSEEESE